MTADLSPSHLARLRDTAAADIVGGLPIGEFLTRRDSDLRDAGLVDVVGTRIRCTKAGHQVLDESPGDAIPDGSPDSTTRG